jgi:hypothetical protein
MSNRQDQAAFEQILVGFSDGIRALAKQTRALLLEVMPDLFEVVWTTQKSAGYGTGTKKNSEHFCHIIPHQNHVNLGFNYGTELPDPDKLLEGTGAKLRHIKIHKIEDLKRPGVKKMVEFASTHRVPPLPK